MLLRRTFLATAAGTSAGLLLARAPFAAETRQPPSLPAGALAYKIFRDGKDVGRHEMTISRDGALLKIASNTDIAVKAAIFTLYSFKQSAAEAWQEGRLMEFTATTDDDGDKHRVEAQPRDNALALTVDGTTRLVDASLAPASLGNPRLVELSHLFDTADGTALSVKAHLVAEEALTVKGARLKARRFAFTGDMKRDIWYDPKGTPVQVGFDGKDGSRIKFVLA